MSDTANLKALYSRLSTQQRTLLCQAANADILPASGALAQIAQLESALSALDALLDESEAKPHSVVESTKRQPN